MRAWEDDRLLEGRCPKCGSSETYPADYSYDPETGEESPHGLACSDCGYDMVFGPTDVLFIAPGEPGSHDKQEDYA